MTHTRQASVSAEYARWWKRLSPDERRTLIESGAFRADDPSDATPAESRSSVNGGHFDFNRAEEEKSYGDVSRVGSMLSQAPSAIDEILKAEDVALSDPRLASLDLAGLRLRATLHFLLEGLDGSSDPSMRLHADIIRIVVGEGKPPRMTVLAKAHNISRAAVSLRCRKLLRRLGLAPSRFMRPEDEVNNMRVASIMRNLDDGDRPPAKESLASDVKASTRSRPREKEAKNLSFSKGSGKPGKTPRNRRK